MPLASLPGFVVVHGGAAVVTAIASVLVRGSVRRRLTSPEARSLDADPAGRFAFRSRVVQRRLAAAGLAAAAAATGLSFAVPGAIVKPAIVFWFLAGLAAGAFAAVGPLVDTAPAAAAPDYARRAVARLTLAELLRGLPGWILGIALGGFLGAVADTEAIRPWFVAEGVILGGLLGMLVEGRLLLSAGRAEPFDAARAAVVASALALPGAPPATVLHWRTGGQGVWNAFAFGNARRRVVLVPDDVAGLPEPQFRAVLAHELAHHALRHLPARLWKITGCHVLVPVVGALCGFTDPVLPGAFALLAVQFLVARRSAREEFEADRWAADRVPAVDLCRALFRMHRERGLPVDTPAGGTHPALAARCTALGVDPADVLGPESAPAGAANPA